MHPVMPSTIASKPVPELFPSVWRKFPEPNRSPLKGPLLPFFPRSSQPLPKVPLMRFRDLRFPRNPSPQSPLKRLFTEPTEHPSLLKNLPPFRSAEEEKRAPRSMQRQRGQYFIQPFAGLGFPTSDATFSRTYLDFNGNSQVTKTWILMPSWDTALV